RAGAGRGAGRTDAQEQRVPQGTRTELARPRDAGRPGRAPRRTRAFSRRVAAAADPLSRRAVLALGRADDRARPQPAALSRKSRAAGVSLRLRPARRRTPGHRNLLCPRFAGGGARRALARSDRGAVYRGRYGSRIFSRPPGPALGVDPGPTRSSPSPRT